MRVPPPEITATVEERLARVERVLGLLVERLDVVLAREGRPGLDDVPELVSVAQAAQVLGRSRTRVLAPAIARGQIRTVTVGRRQMIPKSEIVRIAEEGLPENAPTVPARRSRTRPPARGVGERIRSLPLPSARRA